MKYERIFLIARFPFDKAISEDGVYFIFMFTALLSLF